MAGRIPWDELTGTLLDKYSGQAPRYTSYPTAVEWQGGFDAADFEAALHRADGEAEKPLSIYVHIPYCKRRCKFCGCASDVSDDPLVYDRYLDAVEKEVAALRPHLRARREVTQIHLGGGTPTVLSTDQLTRLKGIISDTFDTRSADEIALEAAPSVTTERQIETLADLGFNRLSLGVQDFTPEVQRAVDRVQSADHTARLIDTARRHGLSINIDLMYGLPKQTPAAWAKNMGAVIGLVPDRLAVFGYAHVPWMRPHQEALEAHGLPDTDARLALFRIAHDALLDAGYVYIGMDHFSKPEDALVRAQAEGRLWRNFQGYTIGRESGLIGLGATAISDIGEAFAQNHSRTERYIPETEGAGLATYRGMHTSPEDRLRRHVITELMCHLGVRTDAVSTQFGIDFWTHFASARAALDELAEDGLVTVSEAAVQVTDKGRMFVRHVAMVFDAYSHKKKGEGPRFSRTV